MEHSHISFVNIQGELMNVFIVNEPPCVIVAVVVPLRYIRKTKYSNIHINL